MSSNSLSIGDKQTLVVQYPNVGDDRDPVATYNDRTVFLTFPDHDPQDIFAGMSVRARVADITERHIRAVVLEEKR